MMLLGTETLILRLKEKEITSSKPAIIFFTLFDEASKYIERSKET